MKGYVTLRIPVWALLMLVLAVILTVTGVALYRNYIFHTWFLSGLDGTDIASVTVNVPDEALTTSMLPGEIDELARLLRNIRIKEEPYKNLQQFGTAGSTFEVLLQSGVRITLSVLSLDGRGMLAIGENYYPVADLLDPNAEETKSFLLLVALFRRTEIQD